MLFWISAALLIAVSCFLMVRAMGRASSVADPLQADIEFYRAQDAEVERQVAVGMMTAEEGAAARAEAGRKLLTLARAAEGTGTGPALRSKVLQLIVLVAIPLFTIPLYFRLGLPGAPDRPFASRTDVDRSEADMRKLIARLDAHLAETPGDVRGWDLALPVYMRLGRYDDAVVAAGRLLDLKGESAERLTTLAETMIFRNKGAADEDAQKLLARALALEAGYAKARFYTALGLEQNGDPAAALTAMQALLADVSEAAEKQAITAQIARLSRIVSPQSSAAEGILALDQKDQQQAIRGMVEGLEARLKSQGGSPEEWLRLVRAFAVLGDRARAGSALSDARAALTNNTDGLNALAALAKELSLEVRQP